MAQPAVIGLGALGEVLGKMHHIENIRPGGMFRLNTCRYRGPDVELSDGTPIRSGDLLGELHLSNRDTLRQQLKYKSRVKAAIAARKGADARPGLAGGARRNRAGPGRRSRPFIAITMLYHGARVLGFEDREFKATGCMRWLYTLGQGFLLALYHPAGFPRFWQGRQDLTLKYIWMSRQKLLHDFLPWTNLN